mgnify:FL=1
MWGMRLNKPRLLRAHTIACFAADWHSGAGSRGYRLLCCALRWLRRHRVPYPLGIPMSREQRAMYDDLVARYADKM